MPPYVVHGREREWDGPPMISRDGIARIQQWLRQSLQAFARKESITYIFPEQQWSLNPWFRIGKRELAGWYLLTSHDSEDLPNLYAKEFFELLRDHINDLAVCEFDGCKTGFNPETKETIYERGIYVRDRSNQHYCSKKCRWAAVKREAKNQQRKEEKMEKKTIQRERRTDAKKKRT